LHFHTPFSPSVKYLATIFSVLSIRRIFDGRTTNYSEDSLPVEHTIKSIQLTFSTFERNTFYYCLNYKVEQLVKDETFLKLMSYCIASFSHPQRSHSRF
jgi:hypothetical protein